jgi:hypothetical protein
MAQMALRNQGRNVFMSIVVVVDNNPQELLHTAKKLKESGAFDIVMQFEDSLKALNILNYMAAI